MESANSCTKRVRNKLDGTFEPEAEPERRLPWQKLRSRRANQQTLREKKKLAACANGGRCGPYYGFDVPPLMHPELKAELKHDHEVIQVLREKVDELERKLKAERLADSRVRVVEHEESDLEKEIRSR